VRAATVSRRVLASGALSATSSSSNLSSSSVKKQDKMAATAKPIESSIRSKLEEFFEPKYLNVLNESGMHAVPKGSETHFKVIVVSERFVNEPLINRHRLVNKALETELKSGVHALSIIAKTPDQWEGSDKLVDKSPPCRGGTGL